MLCSLGEDPPDGKGYIASRANCGPVLILNLALKRWGPLKQQGLCIHQAHLWTIFAPPPLCFKALETLQDDMGY